MEIYWDGTIDARHREMLEALIRRGCEYVGAPENAEVSISFVDKDEIHVLNREYRGVDRPTDVISFPFTQPDEWGAGVISAAPIALGDIIVCMDVAKEQAGTYGHSLERELGFLTVHGLLHLAGYDHNDTSEEQEMRRAQREILGDLIRGI